jgi:hypothetical protein
LPNGGLAPCIGLTESVLPDPTKITGGYTNQVTGIFVNGLFGAPPGHSNPAPQGWDEVVFMFDCNNGSTRNTYLQSYYDTSIPYFNDLVTITGTVSHSILSSALTGGWTVVNTGTIAAPSWVGTLSLQLNVLNDAANQTPHWYFYPNPSATTTLVPLDRSAFLPAQFTGNGGVLIAHQSRLLGFSGQNWTWTNSGVGMGSRNEQFFFTTPGTPDALSSYTTMGNQDEVFVAEHPFGSGAWASLSASQLLVIKTGSAGGAYTLTGDVANPTVTFLGGVQPTYGGCNGASTPVGYFYVSSANGVWLWNGGTTSQKISNQLRDSFADAIVGNIFGYGTQCYYWNNRLYTTGNWFFDIATGGWWRLDNNGGSASTQYVWYGASGPTNLWAATNFNQSSSVPIFYRFSNNVPAPTFSWQSYPMTVTNDRYVNIREVAVKASGTGTITLTFTSDGSTVSVPATFNVSSVNPTKYRLDVGAMSRGITFRIQSTSNSTTPAPIIYSVDIGWYEDRGLNST